METPFTMIERGPRLSGSPANSPRIVSGRASPAKSEEGQMEPGMESTYDQHDPGMRTVDFFDATSDTASDPARSAGFSHTAEHGGSQEGRLSTASGPEASYLETASPNAISRYRAASLKRSSKESRLHPFLRFATGYNPHHERHSAFENTESSDAGSGNELTTAQSRELFLQHPARQSVHQGSSARTSAAINEKPIESTRNSQNDRILGVHAITMSALLRDDPLGRDIMSPLTEDRRTSQLFASLTDRLEGKPDALKTHSRKRSSSAPARKRVSLIPPPISINSPKRTLPEDLVRTPYPFLKHKDSALLRQDSVLKSSPTQSYDSTHPPNHTNVEPFPTITEHILTLSLHHSNPSYGPPRTTQVAIPATAPQDFRSVRSSTLNIREKHFDGPNFDDSELFCRLRNAYAHLAGRWRFMSARRLKRVIVGSEHAGSNPDSPASPSLATNTGFDSSADGLSEVAFLELLRSPAKGRARYVWVDWARRLALGPSDRAVSASYAPFEPHRRPPVPPGVSVYGDGEVDEERRGGGGSGRDMYQEGGREREGHMGDRQRVENRQRLHGSATLEFVQGWAGGRIVMAILVVLGLAIGATLMWILLGLPKKNLGMLPGYGYEGYRGAGGRVEGGCVMGILVLVVGWTGVAGWIWVSWAVL